MIGGKRATAILEHPAPRLVFNLAITHPLNVENRDPIGKLR